MTIIRLFTHGKNVLEGSRRQLIFPRAPKHPRIVLGDGDGNGCRGRARERQDQAH